MGMKIEDGEGLDNLGAMAVLSGKGTMAFRASPKPPQKSWSETLCTNDRDHNGIMIV